jgi:hypothetical protein
MEFQVLGPFEVRREGGPVPLGPAKQRTLLAILLVRAIDENPAPTDSEWLIKRTGVPARLLARRRRFEEAERLAREGVAVAANCEFVVLHADVLLDLAEVLRLAGRPDEAEAATAEAVNIYERKGNVAAAERARALAETG